MTNECACPIKSECGMYEQNPNLPPTLNPVYRHEVCDGVNDRKTGLYTGCVMYNLLVPQDDLGLSESFPCDDINDREGLDSRLQVSLSRREEILDDLTDL